MNDGNVYFWVKPTRNKHLHQYFLCPYCFKYFSSEYKKHPCLTYTTGKPWIEIFKLRNDCNFFVLYVYHNPNPVKGK